jgi:glycosyltransferase involved in cell wall biosynthesis
MTAMPDSMLTLSIVIPALDEEDNVGPLVDEVASCVLSAVAAEVVIVDDGSRDATWVRLVELAATRPWLRPLRHRERRGQSAAMRSGIAHARGRYIGMLDADLQNVPADLLTMLALLERDEADLVQGDRSANRRDNVIRKLASRVGRLARYWAIGDTVRDTGCSARMMRAELARQLPLQYHGMHRFVPAYCALLGARIVQLPVQHRVRHSGATKYGLGVFKRGWSGLQDLLAMRWMMRRLRTPQIELPPDTRVLS